MVDITSAGGLIVLMFDLWTVVSSFVSRTSAGKTTCTPFVCQFPAGRTA
ncbi:MAG: hypothetical protein Q4P24_11950 [Rhodobacterales bacterium]|nr:hypothetical protein [Rhodobacterales bacterium]